MYMIVRKQADQVGVHVVRGSYQFLYCVIFPACTNIQDKLFYVYAHSQIKLAFMLLEVVISFCIV